MTDRISALEAQIAALMKRVDALEKRGGVEPGGLDLTLLERLGSRSGAGFEDARIQGALTFAGAIKVDGRPLVWQRELGAPGVLDASASHVAGVLAAAGHADRVGILKALCAGRQTSTDLAVQLGFSSTGKLYHHLDKLSAVGLVRQVERGTWEIAREKVIPLLVLIGVAADLDPEAVDR